MKNTLLITLLLLATFFCVGQQDNFIKIVGNASHQIKASQMMVTVTLTSIKRDEYQKTREKSIDEIKAELDANLKSMGYSISDLKEIWPPKSNYNKTESYSYHLTLNSKEEAKIISKFSIKGFEAKGFEYIYPAEADVDDYKLSREAIEDAKRKAESLAAFVGKKVGEILSIEDKSSNKIKISGNKNSPFIDFKYNLIITYELLD